MGRTAGSFAASSSRRHPAGSGGSGGGDSRAGAGGRARAIILLCLVALGIQSCLAQQPPEQCNLATFSAEAGSVDEACCDGAASSCPDGIPELCNTACSGVFTDFYDRCREFLAAQVGEDMVGYDQLYTTCGGGGGGGGGRGGQGVGDGGGDIASATIASGTWHGNAIRVGCVCAHDGEGRWTCAELLGNAFSLSTR